MASNTGASLGAEPAADGPREQIRREVEADFPEPRPEPVEYGRVRDYLMALGEPEGPSFDRPVPPLFLLTFGRTRRPHARDRKGGAARAEEDFEFLAPLYVGDVVTVDRRIAAIEEKQTRLGRTFVVRVALSFRNQRGELVGTATTTTLRWGV